MKKKYKLIINGEEYETKILTYKGDYARVSVNNVDYEIEIVHEARQTKDTGPRTMPLATTASTKPEPIALDTLKSFVPREGQVLAPIPGTVVDIKVKEGQMVRADDTVLILEAMKMEAEITAGTDGIVKAINVSKGDSVQDSDVLVEIGVE